MSSHWNGFVHHAEQIRTAVTADILEEMENAGAVPISSPELEEDEVIVLVVHEYPQQKNQHQRCVWEMSYRMPQPD